MCVHCTVQIVAHNIAQNRPDNFPSYPPDNHHCSDGVCLRDGGLGIEHEQGGQRERDWNEVDGEN